MNNIIIDKIVEEMASETILNYYECLSVSNANRDDDNSDKV